jgi:hypothetical protein
LISVFVVTLENIYALNHYNTIEILYSYNSYNIFEITIWRLENIGRLDKVTSGNFLPIIAFLHLIIETNPFLLSLPGWKWRLCLLRHIYNPLLWRLGCDLIYPLQARQQMLFHLPSQFLSPSISFHTYQ